MGELACGIGTIKVESVWHRVPTNMASSRIPPSPLVLADGGAAAPMLHTVCLQVKRLEARIREVCAAAQPRSPPGRLLPTRRPSLRERERAERGGREREEGKGEVDVAR